MSELADLTAQCIRCGFCLESCPTFALTGDETESPRGRIYLVRSLAEGNIKDAADIAQSLDTCIGCRACETACPSGVKYGQILEEARASYRPRPELLPILNLMTSPWRFKLALTMAAAADVRRVPSFLTRRRSLEVCNFDLPKLPKAPDWPAYDPGRLTASVKVLRGCVMPVLFPEVIEATERLLNRTGHAVEWIDGCCGALHSHNSFTAEGRAMASKVPTGVLTNSAGCGSHLLDAGLQIHEVSTFLQEHGLVDQLRKSKGLNGQTATYLDACHLKHGMKQTSAGVALLREVPGLRLIELNGRDLCCGSGGIYNLTQPARANRLQQIKAAEVFETQADFLVASNPGCLQWMAQILQNGERSVQVLHTLTMLESSFTGCTP